MSAESGESSANDPGISVPLGERKTFRKSIASGLCGLGTACGPVGSWLGDTMAWGNGTLCFDGEIIEEIVKLAVFEGT